MCVSNPVPCRRGEYTPDGELISETTRHDKEVNGEFFQKESQHFFFNYFANPQWITPKQMAEKIGAAKDARCPSDIDTFPVCLQIGEKKVLISIEGYALLNWIVNATSDPMTPRPARNAVAGCDCVRRQSPPTPIHHPYGGSHYDGAGI